MPDDIEKSGAETKVCRSKLAKLDLLVRRQELQIGTIQGEVRSSEH